MFEVELGGRASGRTGGTVRAEAAEKGTVEVEAYFAKAKVLETDTFASPGIGSTSDETGRLSAPSALDR